MAVSYKDQFVTINATESITTRIACKRIVVGFATGGLLTVNDGAAALLFKVYIPANGSVELVGPFNLENGIACPASAHITLIR